MERRNRPNGTLLYFLVSALIAPSLSTLEEELRLVTQADVVLPDATGYRYLIPADYTIRLTLDPCRDQAYMCCNNTFGATEIFGNLKPIADASFMPSGHIASEGVPITPVTLKIWSTSVPPGKRGRRV